MILYRTTDGLVVVEGNKAYGAGKTLDELVAGPNAHAFLAERIGSGETVAAPEASKLLAPVGSQEVWAAGVTYLRSRAARMAESKDAGGGDFYDRVYTAERPELFFKSLPHKVVGPGGDGGVAQRCDVVGAGAGTGAADRIRAARLWDTRSGTT